MRSKMVNKSKHIGIIHDHHGPSDHEIEILVRTLKPEKLPPLVGSPYIDQLIAEHYLDELLEGKTLWFNAYNSVVKLENVYFKFEGNLKLYRIYKTMCKVIKRCSLDLKFENEFLSDFKCNRLLLHDYKPSNNEYSCNEEYEMLIGLRINENKIECVHSKCDHN